MLSFILVIKLYYINEKYENTIVINKSKFISYAYRVNNIDEIDDILKEMHKKYYDSTHIFLIMATSKKHLMTKSHLKLQDILFWMS